MKDIDSWIKTKLRNRNLCLKYPATVSEYFRRHTGIRFMYGKVTLTANPSQTFSFHSKVCWPEESYDEQVMMGILDILFSSDMYVVLGCEFVLEDIGWHKIDSCAYAYYMAARRATEKVLIRERFPNNISYD